MQLYILGNNSDDKGNQLEKLTCQILEKLGCSKITTNEIGSGGHEIDVRAEYSVPSLGGITTKPLLCECKAYKSPVAMPDWLKFLGKIFLEEISGDIDGYFIALSGVNGNVSGNYRELLKSKNNIKLITGEVLITHLKEIFQLVSIDTVQKNIEKYIQRKPIEISLCYYNSNIYYLIGFSDNEYSIVSNKGKLIKAKDANKIKTLIKKNTSFQNFIDLEDENNSLARATLIKKYVLSIFLLQNKALSYDEIENMFMDYENQIQDLDSSEIKKALNELKNAKFVNYNTKKEVKYSLKILSDKKQLIDVINFFKYFFGGVAPLIAIGTEQYINVINNELLDEICKIQEGIIIPDEYKEKALKILRWSPSSLLWALYPDQLITTHRKSGKAVHENIESEDTSYFLQKLISLLFEDFKNNALKEYFYKTCNLVELETEFKITIKSKKQAELDMNYKERIGLAQMTKEYNDQIIIIRVLNEQPEPWERK